MTNLVLKVSRSQSSRENCGSKAPHEAISEVLNRFNSKLSLTAADGPEAGQYFYIENIADDRVDELREALAGLAEVEAAYVKPADELPM